MTFIVYGYNSYKYICQKWKIKILYEIPKKNSDNNIWVFNFFLKTIDWFIVFDSFLRVHKILSFYYKWNYSLKNKTIRAENFAVNIFKVKKKINRQLNSIGEKRTLSLHLDRWRAWFDISLAIRKISLISFHLPFMQRTKTINRDQ